MRIGLTYITTVMAGAAAVTIAAAPPAAAQTQQQSCVQTAQATKCQTPGDVEINSSIPAPNPGPWAVYGPFWFPD